MSFLLTWMGWRAPPPQEAARVIRTFVTTLDRLDAAATGRVPPEDTQ
jgi:hypothetical protein